MPCRTSTALPAVTASTYAAQVDERGLTFSPHRPADGTATGEAAGRPVADAGTETLVRTLGITRGGEMIYAADGGPVERAVVGNTAQGLLAPAWGVVEHFEAGGEGVALSWIFSQPLPGAGPVRSTRRNRNSSPASAMATCIARARRLVSARAASSW